MQVPAHARRPGELVLRSLHEGAVLLPPAGASVNAFDRMQEDLIRASARTELLTDADTEARAIIDLERLMKIAEHILCDTVDEIRELLARTAR